MKAAKNWLEKLIHVSHCSNLVPSQASPEVLQNSTEQVSLLSTQNIFINILDFILTLLFCCKDTLILKMMAATKMLGNLRL